MMKRILCIFLFAVMSASLATAHAEDLADQIIHARTTNAFTDTAVDPATLGKIVEAGLAASSARNLQPWHFAVITNREIMDTLSGAEGGGGPSIGGGSAGEPPEAPAGTGQGPNANAGEASAPRESANAEGAVPAARPAAKAGLGSSPVAIIIYTDTASMEGRFYGGNTALFDCGLAAQNMMIAANALGYGAKLISGPTDTLNGEQHDALCVLLGIDTGMSAVAVLLIGESADSGDADAVTGASTRSGMSDKVSYVE